MHRSWTKLAALAPSSRDLQAQAEALAQARKIDAPDESLVPSPDAAAESAEAKDSYGISGSAVAE